MDEEIRRLAEAEMDTWFNRQHTVQKDSPEEQEAVDRYICLLWVLYPDDDTRLAEHQGQQVIPFEQ